MRKFTQAIAFAYKKRKIMFKTPYLFYSAMSFITSPHFYPLNYNIN
jgi:hypothetical protein